MSQASQETFDAISDGVCDGFHLSGGECRREMHDDSLQSHICTILANAPGLMLATLDERGHPLASYLPYASLGAGFAVVVSGLAEHTRALMRQPNASVLFVDAESGAGDAFARSRLSVSVTATFLPTGSPEAANVWGALVQAHGATAQLLQTLPDFSALCLVPQRGRLILGFARAYDLELADLQHALATMQ